MRHAFLIIAHNEPKILDALLFQLKHPDNVIFVHVDKKVEGILFAQFQSIVSKWGGHLFSKYNVKWGDFSMVECELFLYKTAMQIGFDYYHLLSGVDLLIKPVIALHSFIEKYNGYEFIRVATDVDNQTQAYIKTNYYYCFTQFNRSFLGKIIKAVKLPYVSLYIQKFLKINRCKKDKFRHYKGDEWCSLSHNAVNYILLREHFIRERYCHTSCADEIYKQTILMNNTYFRERIYIPEQSFQNSGLRLIDWNRGKPYIWNSSDYDELVQSNNFFARKFESNDMCFIKKILKMTVPE